MSEFKVPKGWKLVPEEPTPEMLVSINWPNDPTGYRLMLAIAPAAPVVQAEQEPVATILPPDLDERPGPWMFRDDWERLRALPAGTRLYTVPPVQGEPVAWIRKNGFCFIAEIEPQDDSEVPLYAAPQPAEQQQPLPCQECGGDGAGGEHEEDCAMAQPTEQQPVSAVRLREALAGLLTIVDESQGAARYYLTGETAEWDEFPEVEAARAALADTTLAAPMSQVDVAASTKPFP